MCQEATGRRAGFLAAATCMAFAVLLPAQPVATSFGGLRPDWRRIGTPVYEFNLASPATGPVDRVWFSPDGERLFARTHSGRYFESQESGGWVAASLPAAPEVNDGLSSASLTLPEEGAKVRSADVFYARLYAFGRQIYRSDDGGAHWTDLTGFKGQSVIGGGVADLAASPIDPDVLAVANQYGVWRSSDGGLSWVGLNDTLSNLPVQRLLSAPSGTRGTRIQLPGYAFEWAPGEKLSWQLVRDGSDVRDEAFRQALSTRLGASLTAVALGQTYSYAGAADGRIWVSLDGGQAWQLARLGEGGAAVALQSLPAGSQTVFAGFTGAVRRKIVRSRDGGINWEDLTGELTGASLRGLAADPAGTALYAATDTGIYFRMLEPQPGQWLALSENLPAAGIVDVKLDEEGNQVYVALDGLGVYAAPAPHRFYQVQVVNSADFSRRPAAPGSLLTVLGGRLLRARAGLQDAPVLHATDAESQIQVPFEVSGSSADLALEMARGRATLTVPLADVSPAIFVDREGSALLLDAANGVLLDAQNPARAGARVQILATGLGKVTPAWPTGAAAPLKEPPSVSAKVEARLDQSPIEVTRATLAPGYVGFYLVEVQLPAIVNGGAGELYLEAGGSQSNHVRIDLAP